MALSLMHLLFPVTMADPLSHFYAFASSPCHGSASASTAKGFKPSLLGLRPSWPVAQPPLSCSSITCGSTPAGRQFQKEGDNQGELPFLASQTNGQYSLHSEKLSSVSESGKDWAFDHSCDSNSNRLSMHLLGSSNKESSLQSSSNQTFSSPTRVRVDNSMNETIAMPSGRTPQKQERVPSRRSHIPSQQDASVRISTFSPKPHFVPQQSVQGKAVAGEHTQHPVDERDFRSFEEKDERSAISRIAEKLHSTKVSRNANSSLQQQQNIRIPSPLYVPAVGDPFFPCLNNSWSTPDHPIPAPGSSFSVGCKFPWERAAAEDTIDETPPDRPVRVKPPSLAELLIPQPELKRLRTVGCQSKKRLKIGRLGVTDGIVSGIHERWHNSELVKVKYDGPASNMKKIHQDLERKTGGLVIWRSGGAAVVYRGNDYSGPVSRAINFSLLEEEKASFEEEDEEHEDEEDEDNNTVSETNLEKIPPVNLSKPQGDDVDLFSRDFEYEIEMDRFLDDLGPRYKDWTGFGRPVPVDGDLLPLVDDKFKPPFRILPYGVHPKLSNLEMTNLRRVARPLAPHFVVGRNRGHQGLATSIVQLWEKCEVAKIAIKRGVQNTNDELMAEELKLLTGGVLLSRDKEFITLYRGKDFLPQALAEVLAEREAMTRALLEREESVRNGDVALEIKTVDDLITSGCVVPKVSVAKEDSVRNASVALEIRRADKGMPTSATVGTDVPETKIDPNISVNCTEQLQHRVPPLKAVRVLQAQRKERRLAIAVRNKMKAEEELQKVQKTCKPSDPPIDQEMISHEEKNMFRKLGLSMKAFLLVGRRGVFGGVIENMHLHWKHRELVKLIYKGKNRWDIEETAKMLANESGGILVGIVPISKGQAIIVYRGKNYHRPPRLRPENLLTKREALKRFTESQRHESLERHILRLEKQIVDLKDDLKSTNTGVVTDLDTRCSELTDEINKGEVLPLERLHAKKAVDKVKGEAKSKGLGPIFRADPLTRKEKLVLRVQALKLGKPAHFHVGKSNTMAGLIRSIRLFFQRHSLVKVGVKGRARGTSVAEIIQEIEDGTGGVLVSLEPCKVIFYRGWPEGQDQPSLDLSPGNIPSDLIEAMEVENRDFDDDSSSYSSESDDLDIEKYPGNTPGQLF